MRILSVGIVRASEDSCNNALARVDAALSDARLADAVALRLIHGRSGGRIRVALHAHLRALGCRFRLAPTNPGVTLVVL